MFHILLNIIFFSGIYISVVTRASDTTLENTSVGIMSQQDLEDFLKEFDDEYEMIITTIPRNGSLTNDEFIQRHEDLANEFFNRLIDVASNESNLKTLVSFVNTIANDIHASEISSDEHESETEDNDIIQIPVKEKANLIFSGTSSDIDGNDRNDTCEEDANTIYNLLVLKNDIKWLTLPFLAVERNSIDVVEMCFKTGIGLEIFRNLKGQTLLNHSIEQSKLNFDIINVLLKCIGVNIGVKHGKTPVMTCIQNREITVKERFALLKRLIDAGADVINRSFYPGTTLHDFINSLAMDMNVEKLNEWKSVIDLLLRKGVDINATDFVGQTALICAITTVPPTGLEDSDAYDLEANRNIVSARRCKIEIVEYLLHKGANMEVIGNNGYTALCMALANQNVDVIETLVKHGANVNHLTNIKMSPAHVICCEGEWSDENDIQTILLPSLRILLNAGLNLNIIGLDDSTVLHFTATKMNHSICEFRVKSGAELGATDYLQRTPLHMAVRNIYIMVLKTLIKAKDIHGENPLTHACLHGNTNAVRILVENGADCKACGDLGIQPIHIAAENGDCSMMAILENAGCDLSTRDASGSTPLHYAASDGNPDTVQYLLTHNVNKNCKDSQGQVPLDLALLRGEYRVSTFLADCPSAVKFGRLPQGIFPNRPLRQMHELVDYLDKITEPLKTIGEPGVGIAKAILHTPGLGKLHLDKGESKQIYESIQQLCMEIVERIGELDPLFQCKLMNAGSSFEGVKVAYPNEFDFVCHLENISAFVEKLENVDIPEYCQIIMKDSLTADISRFSLRSKKSLNAGAVLRHFVRLTIIATYDVLKRPHQHLFSGTLLLNESAAVFRDAPIPYSKCKDLLFPGEDQPTILYTTEWPSEAVGSSILIPNIKEEGMYLIPKCCSKHYMPVVVETIALDSDLWRYSTHHVEAIMMQRLPQKARDCYMLCKAFRLEPLTCSIQVNKTEGWMSETGLQKLYDYDGDDDDGEIHAEEKRNAAKYDLRTKNVHSNSFKADEGRDLDRSEHEFTVRTLHDSSFLTHTDGLTVEVLVGNDNVEDTYELTAEKCIPSYHLKSLFLQEAETILSTTGTFSDLHLQTIPYKVYDRLKTAVETQYLTTLFFPGQNIYRQPQDDDNLPASIKLRMSYIDAILRLLTELGFGFQC
ncbi:hypothetical protein ACJMK2_002514 [Sinanodonta woodiana]|uniref:Uncharacterized protein n=1 Tax=Sinanodonta woodiana TaxID=1069815 RepID=A0ABD3XXS2_SINWO